MRLAAGLRPDPLVTYCAPPYRLAGFKGRERGREGKGKEGKGRSKERERNGNRGKRRGSVKG